MRLTVHFHRDIMEQPCHWLIENILESPHDFLKSFLPMQHRRLPEVDFND